MAVKVKKGTLGDIRDWREETLARMRELILEGVVGIVEGLNPKLIRAKLEAYTQQAPAKKKPAKKEAAVSQKIETPEGVKA